MEVGPISLCAYSVVRYDGRSRSEAYPDRRFLASFDAPKKQRGNTLHSMFGPAPPCCRLLTRELSDNQRQPGTAPKAHLSVARVTTLQATRQISGRPQAKVW
jgi:hypothetical protein